MAANAENAAGVAAAVGAMNPGLPEAPGADRGPAAEREAPPPQPPRPHVQPPAAVPPPPGPPQDAAQAHPQGDVAPHHAIKFPFSSGPPRPIASAAAERFTRPVRARHPYMVARENPSVPLTRLRRPAVGDGNVVIAAHKVLRSLVPGHADMAASSWVAANAQRRPPTVRWHDVEPQHFVLRPDLAHPGEGVNGRITTISKQLCIPTPARMAAHAAVRAALNGGNLTAVWCACLAAVADLAMDELGVYDANATGAAAHWAAENAEGARPAIVICQDTDWEILAGIGERGSLVLRANGLRDPLAPLIIQLATRTPTANHNGSRLRRMAWCPGIKVAVIVPVGTTTQLQRAEYVAGAWRDTLPAAGQIGPSTVQAAVEHYATTYGYTPELQAAGALVQYVACSAHTRRQRRDDTAVHVPAPYGTNVLISEFMDSSAVEPGDRAPNVSLPRASAEWVAGCAVGAIALAGAQYSLARDAGVDPFGWADGSVPVADLLNAAALSGGQSPLLAFALRNAYGLYAPFFRFVGFDDWIYDVCGDYAGAGAQSAAMIESLSVTLFGSGAGADVEPETHVAAGDMRVVSTIDHGTAIEVPTGSWAHTFIANAAMWERIGADPVHRTYHYMANTDAYYEGDQFHTWNRLTPEQEAVLNGAMRGDAPPASVAHVNALPSPPPKSWFDCGGEYRLKTLCMDLDLAGAMLARDYLALGRWEWARTVAVINVGRGAGQAPPGPFAQPPRPRRRRGVADAFANLAFAPDAVGVDPSVLREAYVPTPYFGGPGPEQPANPAGPGANAGAQ